jgi:uncharacterized protein (DUF2147 family)
MKSISFVVVFLWSIQSFAQGPMVTGKWTTIDENTGKPRAVVDIFERAGKVYGKIIKTFPELGDDPDPICDKCSGDDKDKPVLGMEIIRDMEKDGDEWNDGTILDAEHGKTYDCKLWVEDGKLKVRGYVAFFYRTQEWIPYQP